VVVAYTFANTSGCQSCGTETVATAIFCRALQSLGDHLKGFAAHLNSMLHPDAHAPPDLRPIQIGEVWENPITRERATILELPHQNRSFPLLASRA